MEEILENTAISNPCAQGIDADPLATARALLQIAGGYRPPTGSLGTGTVPAAVLDYPITLAIDILVRHAKKCHDRIRCELYPPPLHRFRRMRPEETLPRERERFNATLWDYPEHPLTADVRAKILKKYPDIADAITSGTLLCGTRFSELTARFGNSALKVLAGVLWASHFEGAHAEDLFRLLIPCFSIGIEHDAIERRGDGNGVRPPHPENGHVESLRDAHRELKKKLKSTQQVVDELSGTVRARDTALAALRQEADEARKKSRDAVARAEGLERRVESLTASQEGILAAYDAVERDANKVEQINGELRRDLQQSQQAQREFDVQRAELAREIADLRRQLERLKIKISSIPTGADGVWSYLQEEENRLETERLITAGGARERAAEAWTAHRKLKHAFLTAYPAFTQPAPVRLLPKVPLRLVTLGGSAEIGRSSYFLELGKKRILVDCGIKPNGIDEQYPSIDRIDHLDALLLTHAHTDHIGWVPALVRRFPDLEIYCSAATAALLPVMLEDCRKHYARQLAVMNERARFSRTPQYLLEQYDETDMERVSRRTITCVFGERTELPFGGVSLQFYHAGHILGASSILVEDGSGRRVFFSGDFSSFSQLTVPAAQWPENIGAVDLLVLESTYGSRTHPSFHTSRAGLVGFIRETTERGGSVILASFALGRAQELLKLVLLARENGTLPSDVPVFVDGMINRINPIYKRLCTVELSLDSIHEISGEAERREIAFTAQRRPSIIITTSGMLTGGPAVEYARQLLPDPRHRIVFTGYQDEGAPSRALLDLTNTSGPWTVRLEGEDGNPIEFRAARPAMQVSLSSHADQPGLLEYSRRLAPKHIALVHGNPPSQEALRARLVEIHRSAEVISGPSELIVP